MSAAVEQVRQKAWACFERMGLPSKRDEHWKYTDASRLHDVLEVADKPAPLDTQGLGMLDVDAYRVTFINGVLDVAQSQLPDGVSLGSWTDMDDHDALADLLMFDEDAPLSQGFEAYNAAKARDGVALCLADGCVLDKPLYVLHVANQSYAVRHGLMLGSGAQAQVVEHFMSVGSERALSNCVTAVVLKSGASLEHGRVQEEGHKQSHVARVDVRQCADSSYTFYGVELGGMVSRSDVLVDLAEAGASCSLHGLFVLDARQHADHHTHIDHRAPDCRSREHYRTVLDGRSHGVFNGKVLVHRGASGTDSNMQNGNLLLSKHAEIDTKPELEIYNDDVKCAHGATVGQLDDKQLFYLRSRGVSEEQAQELLTFAFADEALSGLSIPAVRRYIERAAFAKLPYGDDLEGLLA